MLNKYFKRSLFLISSLLTFCLINASSEKELANKIANTLIKSHIYKNFKNDTEKIKQTNKRLKKLINSDEMKRLHQESIQIAKKCKGKEIKGKTIKIDGDKDIVVYPARLTQLFRNIEHFFKFLYQNLQKVNKQDLVKRFDFNCSQTEELNKTDFSEIFKDIKCLLKTLGFKEAIVEQRLEEIFNNK